MQPAHRFYMSDNALKKCLDLKELVSAVKIHLDMQQIPLFHPESLAMQNNAQLHPVLLH